MLAARKHISWPWRAPPHFGEGGEANVYHLSAACYEHQPFISKPERRDELTATLRELVESSGGDLRAWVVLPTTATCLPMVFS